MLHWLKDSISAFCPLNTDFFGAAHPPSCSGSQRAYPQAHTAAQLMQMGRTIQHSQWWPGRNLSGEPHIMTAGGTWDLPHRHCSAGFPVIFYPAPFTVFFFPPIWVWFSLHGNSKSSERWDSWTLLRFVECLSLLMLALESIILHTQW